MADLKLVAKMAYHRALDKVSKGEAPMFLGTSGLVALMYERLVQFGKTNDTDMLLDLAADAVLALSTVVPDFKQEIGLDNMVEDTTTEQEQEVVNEPDTVDDEGGRWTPIPGGQKLHRDSNTGSKDEAD